MTSLAPYVLGSEQINITFPDRLAAAFGLQRPPMKVLCLLCLIIGVGVSSQLMADALASAAKVSDSKPHKAIKPFKMTCREFVELDEVTRPQVVYWSEGFTKKGKPENAIIDMDTTNQLLPILVQDCSKEPQASFWSKVKVEFKKVF